MSKVDKAKMKNEAEEAVKITQETAKAAQAAEDNQKADEIFNARQEVTLKGIGTLIFEHPNVGLTIDGDMASARFKSYHLKLGDLMTEQQLKFIYKKPTTIIVDGKATIVGDGSWTDSQENRLEDLPNIIKQHKQFFEEYRADYQNLADEALRYPETEEQKPERDRLLRKAEERKAVALEQYQKMIEHQMELLELQTMRMSLFSISLEEMANLEKIKLYIPHCIKIKDGDEIRPLWKTQEEAMNSSVDFIKIVSLFNLFLRGADISFFGDIPDGQIV